MKIGESVKNILNRSVWDSDWDLIWDLVRDSVTDSVTYSVRDLVINSVSQMIIDKTEL